MHATTATSNAESLRNSIISMATESWRFSRVFERVLSKLDAGEKERYQSQFRWFVKKTEDALGQAGLKIQDLSGQQFDAGMAVTALNIDEFASADSLFIEQMIEPIILDANGAIIKSGIVTLGKQSA